jgi:hypothetical protein
MNNDWYGLRPKETRRGKQSVKNNKNMTKKSTFLTLPLKRKLKNYSESEQEETEVDEDEEEGQDSSSESDSDSGSDSTKELNASIGDQ